MSTYQYVLSKGYPNVQNYVNSGPNGTINQSRLNEIINYMKSIGWAEIDPEDYKSIDSGTLIKYITNDNTTKGGMRLVEHRDIGEEEVKSYGSFANKFRSGGWFIKWDKGDNGHDYILYRGHNKCQPPVPVPRSQTFQDCLLLNQAQQTKNQHKKRKSRSSKLYETLWNK